LNETMTFLLQWSFSKREIAVSLFLSKYQDLFRIFTMHFNCRFTFQSYCLYCLA